MAWGNYKLYKKGGLRKSRSSKKSKKKKQNWSID